MGEHEYFDFDDKSFQHELENDPDFCLQPTKKQKIIKNFFNVGGGNNSLAGNSNSNGQDIGAQQLCMPSTSSFAVGLSNGLGNGMAVLTQTAGTPMPSTSSLNEETDNRCSDEQSVIEQLSKLALFDGTFYTIAKIAANRVIEAKCELCEPRKNYIRGSREATSNFLKHLKVRHEGSIEQYQLYKVQKKNNSRKSLNMSGTINTIYATPTTISTPTPNPIYCEVPSQNTCSTSDSSNNLSPIAMEFDGLIPFVRPSTSSSSTSTSVAKKQGEKQSTFEYNVSRFAISAMLPLSCIDCDSFKALFAGMHVNLKFLNKDVFEKKINDTVSMKMKSLKAKLSNVPYICIGANIWRMYGYRYLYVTAHWIDDSYQRQTDTLACRRVYSEEIPDRIPEFLKEVYVEFEIDEEKIVGIVTNNTTLNYNILVELKGTDQDEIFKLENWVKDIDDQVGNTKTYTLPIDSLNQIAVHDVNNAIKNDEDWKNKHYSVVKKWFKLYKFVETYDSDNAEEFEATFKQFPYPKIRFWTSFFNTFVKILKKQTVIKDMFKHVKMTTTYFTDDELKYIEEYCILMKPLAETIEYLEKNDNNFYGFQFPAILSLKRKYDKMQHNPALKDLKMLTSVVIDSLNERFGYLRTVNEQSRDAIIAAIVIPSMKLRWLNALNEFDQLNDFKTMHNLVAQAMNTLSPPTSNNTVGLPVQQPDDDFFEFDDQTKSTNDLYELEISHYLQDSRRNLKMLDGYKMIKQLFLRYNTLISSYGPSDQIFCFEIIEDEPKREVFANGLFEKYVLLHNFD